MFVGIVSGLISGIICAVLIALYNSCFNVRAKTETQAAMQRLIVYMDSINNDIIWGSEDNKSDYYDNLLNKVYFSYIYLDIAKQSMRPLNFLFHHPKYILKQYKEIECGLNYILLEVESARASQEKLYRLASFANKFQTQTRNVLSIRAEFVLNLLASYSLEESIEKSCMEDSDASNQAIKTALSQL